MERSIRIKAGELQLNADLNNTETGKAIWDTLPITASASAWGDEIYFGIPVDSELEDGKEVVDLGDLGYWPPGHAFCIFFGPTPASNGDEIRPASAVTVIGKVQGDVTLLRQVPSGTRIVIERAEQ